MNTVQIGKVYRHFKGNYYFVENVGYSSESQERLVIYKPLYNRDDNKAIWIRPEKMFLEEMILPEKIILQVKNIDLKLQMIFAKIILKRGKK